MLFLETLFWENAIIFKRSYFFWQQKNSFSVSEALICLFISFSFVRTTKHISILYWHLRIKKNHKRYIIYSKYSMCRYAWILSILLFLQGVPQKCYFNALVLVIKLMAKYYIFMWHPAEVKLFYYLTHTTLGGAPFYLI